MPDPDDAKPPDPVSAALSPEGARRFYDRIGRLQDTQAFYEDAALDDLVAHCRLAEASRVVEVACGTGRLARRLLEHHLPAEATYLGIELSPRMASIARDRLRPWGERAVVEVGDAVHEWPTAADGADRVLATYLFDLLDDDDTRVLLDHVAGSLSPDGLLAAASLAPGARGLPRAVSRVWTAVWRRRPGLVGGCRPVRLADGLGPLGWRVEHRATVTAWALTSEVVVAGPPDTGRTG